MGDWRYVGLSIVISFIGPFYFLEEKIYHFNEAERIARETCISFNQEFGYPPENIDKGTTVILTELESKSVFKKCGSGIKK